MSPTELYDRIGRSYRTTRREDPRIAGAIHDALGDARTVLNVGAGTGSYEPRGRTVLAVEPSEVMVAQRPPGAAPAVRAQAEALPFGDSSFDAAMAILSDHHWQDRARGLGELRRVARRRAVVFTWDPRLADRFWLTRDYLPGYKRLPMMSIDQIAQCIGATRIDAVPIPHDCRDGFYHGYWRRPAAYLDARVRAGISVFARLPGPEAVAMVRRLRADLEAGTWASQNADLFELDELDFGYRLLTADFV